MGDVVNLRKARKQAERAFARLHAAENRLRFGRTKAERELASTRDAKVRRDLDQHRVEAGDER